MAQLILTHHSKFRRSLQIRSAMPLTLKVGKFFLFFSMTFMIGLLSFFYLVKSTEIHTKGYQLRKLEIEKNTLVQAREQQDTTIAKLRALNSIRESEIARTMIPMRKPVFIREDGSVAQLPTLGSP